jgi:hypothetical protein
MLPRLLALAVAASSIAACDGVITRDQVAQLELADMTAKTNRAIEEGFFELPFTRGVIAVIYESDGQITSDRLYPCASGQSVCLNSPQGEQAQVLRTDVHYVLDYGDRTFFLRPGGGGTLRDPSGDAPLAWNAYINGIPAWSAPTSMTAPD